MGRPFLIDLQFYPSYVKIKHSELNRRDHEEKRLNIDRGLLVPLPGRMPHGYGSLWAEKSTELTACLKIRP